MRRRGALLLLALAAAGCAAPLWERTARLPLGRLHVPRTFAPLVPGSIYPDRSRPVPARGLPGVLVACRNAPARVIAEDLGRRGLLSLEARRGAPLEEALEALRTAPEAGGPLGLVVEAPVARPFPPPGVAAVVVLGEPPAAGGEHPPVLVLRVGAVPGPELPGVSERWYASSSAKLPSHALQDAADWLAEKLGGSVTGPANRTRK